MTDAARLERSQNAVIPSKVFPMLGFKVRMLNTGTECRSLIVSRLTDKVDKIKYQNRVPILENNLYGGLDGLNVSIGLSTKEEIRKVSSLRARPVSSALPL